MARKNSTASYDAEVADNVPYLDVSGVYDEEGGTLTFFAVNRHGSEPLVLEAGLQGFGEARIVDCFTMRAGGRKQPYRQLLRIVEGVRGRVDFRAQVQPRFDYGEVRTYAATSIAKQDMLKKIKVGDVVIGLTTPLLVTAISPAK